MAVDKLVDSTQLDADLTSVANAIRTKGGTSGSLAFPAGFVSAIAAISGGGLPVSVLNHETVTPSSLVTSSNQITLELSACESYLLVAYPESDFAPDSSVTLLFFAAKGNGLSSSSFGVLLRANGTQGTDGTGGFGSFNASTGVLKYPSGNYCNLKAGTTYHFWLFEIGGVASA